MPNDKKLLSGCVVLIALIATAWWLTVRPVPAPVILPPAAQGTTPRTLESASVVPPKPPTIHAPESVISETRVVPPSSPQRPILRALPSSAPGLLPMPAAPAEPASVAVSETFETDGTDHATEIQGTERMVTAHGSLRTPAIADPDSASNRQILQTMVTKALVRAQAQTTGLPASN